MSRKEIVKPAGMGAPRPPFSLATKFGNLVFVAGQAAHNFDTMAVEGGIREQTVQAMERVKRILEGAGASTEHVVDTTCYLANIADFGVFNEEYRKYFPSAPPARTTIQSTLMAENGLIEISVTACIPGPGEVKEGFALGAAGFPAAPFSPGMRFGNLVFVAGQSAYNPEIRGAEGDMREQVNTTLNHVKTVLEGAGSSMENVLTTYCYVTSRADFAAFNEEYRKHFPNAQPARATLQMVQPAQNGLIEVEVVACTNQARKEIITPSTMAQPRVPFSLGTRLDDLVFVSGQAAYDADVGRSVGDIREQTRTTLERLKVILEAGGTSMENVLDATCWLAKRSDFAAFNEEYRKFFPEAQPARATVEATLMADNGLVEIACIAGVPDGA